MTKQVLTKMAIRKAVRAAIKAGKLGALKRRKHGRYRYSDGAMCVIGCALSPDNLRAAAKAEKYAGYFSISSFKLRLPGVMFADKKTLDWARSLQCAHDNWAREQTDGWRRNFMRLLRS